MVVLGFILAVVTLIIGLILLSDDEIGNALISFTIFIIGVGMIFYDVTSPVIAFEESEIISNNYDGIQFDKPCRIKIIKYEAERKFAISGSKTEIKFFCKEEK